MKDENIVKVRGLNLPISTKQSIEICNFIRGKTLNLARKQLNLVLENKLAIPLKRFHKDRGHRKGNIGPGFFPQKATKTIIKLLNTLEANAQDKGMGTETLYLKEVIANKASTPLHYGRRRRKMKRTHIEIKATEKESIKEIKKAEPKEKEPKQEPKKPEPKKKTSEKSHKKQQKND